MPLSMQSTYLGIRLLRNWVRLHLGQVAASVGPDHDAAKVAGDERSDRADRMHVVACVGDEGAFTAVESAAVKVVSERLGHASVGITLDTYSHAIPAMQEDAAAKIAALVGE